MTGRELIIHILANGLEDEPVVKDGKLVGFMNETEAAISFGVGVATVRTWVKRNMLPSVQIGNVTYIPIYASVTIA